MTRTRATSRRGFALVYVMMVALVISLVLSATLTRQDAQIRLVHRQVRDYQQHHDMLGARAIVELWLNRTQPRELVAIIQEPGPHYQFEIEGVGRLQVTARDGQGLPLANARSAPGPMRDAYTDMLDRLPEDRSGLVRPGGSAPISAATAPAEVLAALLPDEDAGERFAEDVIERRERAPITEDDFFRLMSAQPGGDTAVIATRPMVVFQPTIWRLDLTVTDERGETALFGMLAEREQSGAIVVLEWLTEADLRLRDQKRAEREETRSSRSRRSRNGRQPADDRERSS